MWDGSAVYDAWYVRTDGVAETWLEDDEYIYFSESPRVKLKNSYLYIE